MPRFKWIPRWNRAWDIQCSVCYNVAFERHHIIYEPEYLATLCIPCHKIITKLNRTKARKKGYKPLTNKDRLKVYRSFCRRGPKYANI